MFDDTVLIGSSDSESNVIDCEFRLILGVETGTFGEASSDYVTGAVTFKAAEKVDGTYKPVYDNGTLLVLPIAANTICLLDDVAALLGCRFIKVVTATTAGVASPQASDTTMRLITRA